MMADVHELYESEEVDDLIARVSDEVLLQKKTVDWSRSWSEPESASASSIGSEARAASLRNGLSARHTGGLRSVSCRFPSRQGDIVRALEAREQNRSFGRHGDISRALEAREKNRVSLQQQRAPAVSSAAEERESKGRATAGVEAAAGEIAQVRFEPTDRGKVLSSQAGGTSVPHPHARSQQDTQSNPGAPAAAVPPKEQRKSNLKTSSLKVTAPSTEDKNEAPKGRVLILTSGPLGQTEVPVTQPAGFSSGSGRLVQFQGQSEPLSVSAAGPIVGSDEQGISRGSREVHSAVLGHSLEAKAGTAENDGSRAPIDTGEHLPQAVTRVDERGAKGALEFGEEKRSGGVPPVNTEIVSESPRGNHISTASQVVVSAPAGFSSAKEYLEDSELLGADLEARLQLLKAKDESSLRTPSGRIPASLVSLSDQLKALRSGSTRVLVSHLTSSASAPNLSTRIPAVTSSRLTSSVSASQLQGKAPPSSSTGPVTRENSVIAPQSSSDPSSSSSSSSCSCPCFPYIVKRRRRRKLEGSARRPSFSHPSPPSGLQKLQTPVATNKSFRAEEDVRIRGSPHEHGEEEQALFESVLDEVRLETEADDWAKDATAMKESLYGPNILKSFSLEQVTLELSKVSRQEESLTRMAEKLVRWAKDSASLDQQGADDQEQGSSNGDISLYEERYSKTALNGFYGSDSEGEEDELANLKRKRVKRKGKRPNSM